MKNNIKRFICYLMSIVMAFSLFIALPDKSAATDDITVLEARTDEERDASYEKGIFSGVPYIFLRLRGNIMMLEFDSSGSLVSCASGHESKPGLVTQHSVGGAMIRGTSAINFNDPVSIAGYMALSNLPASSSLDMRSHIEISDEEEIIYDDPDAEYGDDVFGNTSDLEAETTNKKDDRGVTNDVRKVISQAQKRYGRTVYNQFQSSGTYYGKTGRLYLSRTYGAQKSFSLRVFAGMTINMICIITGLTPLSVRSVLTFVGSFVASTWLSGERVRVYNVSVYYHKKAKVGNVYPYSSYKEIRGKCATSSTGTSPMTNIYIRQMNSDYNNNQSIIKRACELY